MRPSENADLPVKIRDPVRMQTYLLKWESQWEMQVYLLKEHSEKCRLTCWRSTVRNAGLPVEGAQWECRLTCWRSTVRMQVYLLKEHSEKCRFTCWRSRVPAAQSEEWAPWCNTATTLAPHRRSHQGCSVASTGRCRRCAPPLEAPEWATPHWSSPEMEQHMSTYILIFTWNGAGHVNIYSIFWGSFPPSQINTQAAKWCGNANRMPLTQQCNDWCL